MRDQLNRSLRVVALLALYSTILFAQAATVLTADHGPNAPSQLSKPYVILVSFDGFRYDYAKKYHAEHLLALAAEGASAPEGMIPSYPSVTFPNHYSIVTGLYPEHHGIIANSFYDPERKEKYTYHDPKLVRDGSWYSGTPLWNLAEQQGMRSASFFWVASDADIQKDHPSYYVNFDGSIPNRTRVDQALAWLHLPEEKRPHFITLYFSDADGAGHEHGPDSPEVADTVHRLDSLIGELEVGIKESKLPVDLIVIADHGMAKVEGDPIHLDKFGLDASLLTASTNSLIYAKSNEDAQKTYESLRGKSDKFTVYRRAQMPAHLHYDSNPREGDPVVVPNGPYFITAVTDPNTPDHPPVGAHGYDPAEMPEMKALFLAVGPDIRRGVVLKPFENVNIYPLIVKILGLDITNLKTGPIDGKLSVLEGILQTGSGNKSPIK